jgi:hypothetical protein
MVRVFDKSALDLGFILKSQWMGNATSTSIRTAMWSVEASTTGTGALSMGYWDLLSDKVPGLFGSFGEW